MNIRGPYPVLRVRETILAGVIEILQDFPGHIFPVVPVLVESLLVVRVDGVVIVWHRAEGLYLAEVEHGPEEPSDTLIVIEYGFRRVSIAHVVQIVVNGAELGPVACAPVRGVLGGIIVHEIGRLSVP